MRVSVIITSYNYGRFIGRAIASALGQSVAPLEVIVVDDGSSDDSWSVIQGFGDRIRAVQQVNAGAFAALTRGFRMSTGELIISLDSDDELLPEAIARHLAVFAADPACVVSQGRMRLVDADGQDLGSDHFDRPWLRGQLSHLLLREGRLYAWPYTSGNCWRRAFIDTALTCQPQVFISDDGYFHSIAALFGTYGDAGAVVANYRVHGANYCVRSVSTVDGLNRIVAEEHEKLRCLVHFARNRGHDLTVERLVDGSLKQTRNFYAWRILGASDPPGVHPMTAGRAWRNTLRQGWRLEAWRQLIWLAAVALASADQRQRLALRVVGLVATKMAALAGISERTITAGLSGSHLAVAIRDGTPE